MGKRERERARLKRAAGQRGETEEVSASATASALASASNKRARATRPTSDGSGSNALFNLEDVLALGGSRDDFERLRQIDDGENTLFVDTSSGGGAAASSSSSSSRLDDGELQACVAGLGLGTPSAPPKTEAVVEVMTEKKKKTNALKNKQQKLGGQGEWGQEQEQEQALAAESDSSSAPLAEAADEQVGAKEVGTAVPLPPLAPTKFRSRSLLSEEGTSWHVTSEQKALAVPAVSAATPAHLVTGNALADFDDYARRLLEREVEIYEERKFDLSFFLCFFFFCEEWKGGGGEAGGQEMVNQSIHPSALFAALWLPLSKVVFFLVFTESDERIVARLQIWVPTSSRITLIPDNLERSTSPLPPTHIHTHTHTHTSSNNLCWFLQVVLCLLFLFLLASALPPASLCFSFSPLPIWP